MYSFDLCRLDKMILFFEVPQDVCSTIISSRTKNYSNKPLKAPNHHAFTPMISACKLLTTTNHTEMVVNQKPMNRKGDKGVHL